MGIEILESKKYITSDDEFNVGDWLFYHNPHSDRKVVVKCTEKKDTWFDYKRQTLEIRQVPLKFAKKIVSTTDQKLIDDKVQSYIENESVSDIKIDLDGHNINLQY